MISLSLPTQESSAQEVVTEGEEDRDKLSTATVLHSALLGDIVTPLADDFISSNETF